MSRSQKSKYTLLVDNVAGMTRSRDIKYEMERWGPVLAVERDSRYRCALVEFKSSREAADAWDRMDNFLMDGKRWKVEWATREDFRFFGWKWTEGDDYYYSSKRGRSRSRSRSKSPSRSPARSPSTDSRRSESPPRKSGSRDNKADPSP